MFDRDANFVNTNGRLGYPDGNYSHGRIHAAVLNFLFKKQKLLPCVITYSHCNRSNKLFKKINVNNNE